MNEFRRYEALFEVALEVSREKPDLRLVGLFYREDGGRPDLIVSAPWVNSFRREDYDYLITKLKKHLTEEQFLSIGGIVLLEPDIPFVEDVFFQLPRQATSGSVTSGIFDGKKGSLLLVWPPKLLRPRPHRPAAKSRTSR